MAITACISSSGFDLEGLLWQMPAWSGASSAHTTDFDDAALLAGTSYCLLSTHPFIRIHSSMTTPTLMQMFYKGSSSAMVVTCSNPNCFSSFLDLLSVYMMSTCLYQMYSWVPKKYGCWLSSKIYWLITYPMLLVCMCTTADSMLYRHDILLWMIWLYLWD